VYTLVLAIFIARDYPAAAPSVLPLSVEEQYPVQIWYQGPLFFATTALAATVLVLAGRVAGQSPDLRLAFARVAFASVVPFFFTTLLIEFTLALALLVGLVQPDAVLNWLLGSGRPSLSYRGRSTSPCCLSAIYTPLRPPRRKERCT
jgi:hypothetical protein